MHAIDTWRSAETKTVLWKAIRAAGQAGASRKYLLEHSGKSSTSLMWNLTNMARDGYIHRPSGNTARGHWAAGPRLPPIEGLVLDLALELLDDCPAGMAEPVLSSSIGCGVKALQCALAVAERDGRVERMQMPPAHGGGLGWCLAGMSAAGEAPPARLNSVDLQHEHVRMLPVLEVDIDRIHNVQRGDLFDAVLHDDGRLSITSGSIQFSLPAAHTRRLLEKLAEPALQRLFND